ncbi:MAG: hypothetical protein HY438_03695 [DPANN group archaeon]|nr:hypothetical protein [DPANN group archaeon]
MAVSFSGASTRTGLEKKFADETPAPTLLDKLGGVLTSSKEKLRAAGQIVRQNEDLILFAGMYINTVVLVATVSLDMAYHPEHFARIAPNLAKNLPIPLWRAYAATATIGAALTPIYAMVFYNKFKNGNVFGI